ncbi:glycosyltransferase [Hufsiella ginkgonis]|uniref:Glycosyltransferase n=1 Tax=Hufsiella ginkgonis TaxID=2695274 RepID=A0A7K1Y2I0_9SPHI|nr:glycosyltransferase [Hufsiella ginkgonis]MXV17451.1 hypothetical protein [Hufsiella ginkgonis]
MLKILSFQPVSLYQNGGASRVLRRLYAGRESQVTSLGIVTGKILPQQGELPETVITAFPAHRYWMRWKARDLFTWAREKLFKNLTVNRLRRAASGDKSDVLHMVQHGPFCTALCTNDILRDKQLWVSFHDHFSLTGGTFADTKRLWTQADRRLAISVELGEEYRRLFGDKEFEIITDGVLAGELSPPRLPGESDAPLVVYFSGSLHLEYYPLFEVLVAAMEVLCKQGMALKLVLRGTQQLSFLENKAFITEYRTSFISDEAIKAEMDEVTILYLPIKFSPPEFYLYSLSTKMVSYLGSSGAILYHGPAGSAAGKMLDIANAAVSCNTLDVNDMVNAISALVQNRSVSANAGKLACERFDLEAIRKQFWKEIS